MRFTGLALLLSLLGCTKDAPKPPAPVAAREAPRSTPRVVAIPGALFAVSCDDVTAVWTGPADAPEPRRFAAEGLSFRFADGGALAYSPKGELFGPDWDVEVFSPDCAWVLVPSDHYGPYQLVRRAELTRVLSGASAPATVAAPLDGGEPARVHSQAHWVSSDEVEFQASCCGGAEVWRAKVSSPSAPRQVFFAPSAPHGLKAVDGGFEVMP